ncbi:MAG: diguanylate cyclase [Coxiellaceae bacterium]|nr:diguanylate cyclase [Coxiellaceae bacterium]
MEKPAALEQIPFLDIIENANDIIMVTKADPFEPPGPEIIYVNNAFTKLTGYSAAEAIGNTPRMLQGPETNADTRNKIRQALQQQKPLQVEILNYSKTGDAYWLELQMIPLPDTNGNINFFAAIQRDLTQKKAIEKQLQQLAAIDELTQIYNRRTFFEKADYEIKRIQRSGLQFGVMIVDIDDFTSVNDTSGHQAGDAILRELSKILINCIRDIDTLARFGGEEFAFILPLTDQEQTEQVAKKVLTAVQSHRFDFNGKTFPITASIGCTICSASDADINIAIARADKALYDAKNAGKNCIKTQFE